MTQRGSIPFLQTSEGNSGDKRPRGSAHSYNVLGTILRQKQESKIEGIREEFRIQCKEHLSLQSSPRAENPQGVRSCPVWGGNLVRL